MAIDWRKRLVDLLLKIVQYLNKNTQKKYKIRKENIFTKDIHLPTWVVGIFIFLTLILIFVYEFGFFHKTFFGILFLITIFSFFTIYFFKKHDKELLNCDDSVVLIGLILISFIFIILICRNTAKINFLATPLSAATMLLNMFLGPLVAFTISFLLILTMTIFYDYNFLIFITMLFMCLTALICTTNIMNRKSIAKAGVYIGFVNLITVITLHFFFIVEANELITLIVWGIVNGLMSSIIVIGLLPYLESFFSITTNIKLLELADFMQPVFKRMLVEAPGTYHHSLIVGNLAESAAREIGANPILARAGAYYHDIGKIEKADYFIENKSRFEMNKHDELSPNLSALIITSHIKDGVAFAKKLKLPKKLINIIEEHHGNSIISYFYDKAKQEFDEENVDPEKYRYPFPKPRSKEAAIIMLADSVEAAMHSTDDFSHTNIKSIVNKIINAKFIDEQLDDAEITLYDLNIISKSFINTLSGIYHNRISYPSLTQNKDEDNIIK